MSRRNSVGLVVFIVALGLVFGCGSPQPTTQSDANPTNPKQSSGGTPVPLVELLAQLPKDHWPKDWSDSLRCEKAKAWYKANIAGKRALLPIPDPKAHREFTLDEKNGKYTIRIVAFGSTVKLFEREWLLCVYNGQNLRPSSNVIAQGLSESAAERLRNWAGDPPLELNLTVDEVGFTQSFMQSPEATVVVSAKDDLAITGYSK